MDLRSGLFALVIAFGGAEAVAAGEEAGLLDRTAGNWSAGAPEQPDKAEPPTLAKTSATDQSVTGATGLSPSEPLPLAVAVGLIVVTPGESRAAELARLPSVPLFPSFAGGILAYTPSETTFSGQVTVGAEVLGRLDPGSGLAAPVLSFGGLTVLNAGDRQ